VRAAISAVSFREQEPTMSVYQKLAANCLFPLHERLKGHDTTRVHAALDKSQWYTPDQIQQLQLDRLKVFLQVIGETVPYYQSLFQRLQFNPLDLSGLEHLQRLPLLDKKTIRENTEAMKSCLANKLQKFNTGGSSGAPLIFFLGTERVSHDVAAKRRATRWWDVDIGDNEMVIWGSPIELGSQDRIRLLRDKLFRTKLLPAFDMSTENLNRFVDQIQRQKPKMLFGYPSSLALIADHADSIGTRLDNLGIKVAFVTSERLYDEQRGRIERVFSCPVANGYGGRDAGFIAHECPEGSMHITAEDIIVEIVDQQGNVLPPGESGEIVVTHLYTSEFPFVRYRTGDVGVLGTEACRCGRGLPVLASLEGRTTDFITAADGTVMHGLALIYVMRDLAEIDEFRISQESLQHTHIQVALRSSESARSDTDMSQQQNQLSEHIEEQFKRRLGSEVRISVEFVAQIPRERSGKFRYVVSKVERA